VPLSVMAALKDKEVLVGAINVATNEIETPEKVAATLRAALEFVDPERLIACTNCGMAPLPRHVAEGKLHALGAGAEIIRRELAGR
jgi:5-methyltetrahydropteroyltriglutamate--homocysteine methyltransferase